MSEGAGGEERIKIHNEQDRGSGYIWKATTGRFPARIMLLGGASYPEQRTPSSFLFTNSHYIWGWMLSGIYLLPILSLPELCYQTDILAERLLPAGPILEQCFDAKESFPRKTQNCPALRALPSSFFTSPQTHPQKGGLLYYHVDSSLWAEERKGEG